MGFTFTSSYYDLFLSLIGAATPW